MADFWRVNSYAYPNPFSKGQFATQAWRTLLSFYEFSSYSKLKEYWSSTDAPRNLSSHAVESWKAAFEEFGLLYVLSGSDVITITPAGYQFREAAKAKNVREFVWIGLCLLLRYPLRGPRLRSSPSPESDLLLYWYFYAAMRELHNYLWRSELDRILCQVFQRDQAETALARIQDLRAGRLDLEEFPFPDDPKRGAFYNSINQVIVHAGMYHYLLTKRQDEGFYGEADKEQRIDISQDWLSMVDAALGGTAFPPDCDDSSVFVARMPAAPDFGWDEQAYFEYLGAEIKPMSVVTATEEITYAPTATGRVAILEDRVQYQVHDAKKIVGSIQTLCQLAVGQRVILSHDLGWSYVVEQKVREGPDDLMLMVRKARPITRTDPIVSRLEGDDD